MNKLLLPDTCSTFYKIHVLLSTRYFHTFDCLLTTHYLLPTSSLRTTHYSLLTTHPYKVTKLLVVLIGYLLLEVVLIVATALAAPIRATEFQWKAFPDCLTLKARPSSLPLTTDHRPSP